MLNRITPDILRGKLEKVNEDFQENELAYLALTRKIESPIKDKLAFRLHRKLYSQNLLVSREWQRADVAVLENGKPIAIFELKAMFTFDATDAGSDVNGYPNLMIEDLRKIRNRAKIQELATDDMDLYSVLLATHSLKKIDESLSGTVLPSDYADGVNKAFNLYETPEEILSTCANNIANFFESKSTRVTQGDINAGKCFGIEVRIPFWIIGPFGMSDKLP
jgi:hypothetical protein